ncbi:MAG: dephospho-CoA kinase [Chloroflexi bacterium]|nr:dephospho-CoA kinase [Chloroflexota bacterium]PKB57685.1 MAG: dephospho-CoA kinase [SAR202 cluster bacterium Casp-Chloro-G3]
MIVIGLTGGIGTGKSEVARILQALGAVIINADQLGHQAYTPHTEIWDEVVKAFGEGILQPSGEIDRKQLGAIVFADPSQLARLNQIMHPRMARMVSAQIEKLREGGESAVVVEAAVLFEAGWDGLVDEVWTTESPLDAVVDRLMARNGLDKAEVVKRIKSQMSSEERSARSQVVVDNSRDVATLENTVRSLWDTRVKGIVGKV